MLLRLAAGMALLVQAVPVLISGPPAALILLQALSIGLAILMLAGLGTPAVGVLVALDALWNIVSFGHSWLWILVATRGTALALVGPGAWSVDALLFGWKRIEIRNPDGQSPPPV